MSLFYKQVKMIYPKRNYNIHYVISKEIVHLRSHKKKLCTSIVLEHIDALESEGVNNFIILQTGKMIYPKRNYNIHYVHYVISKEIFHLRSHMKNDVQVFY